MFSRDPKIPKIDFSKVEDRDTPGIWQEMDNNGVKARGILEQFKEAERQIRITEWDDKPCSVYGNIVKIGEKFVTLIQNNSIYDIDISKIKVIEDYNYHLKHCKYRSSWGE